MQPPSRRKFDAVLKERDDFPRCNGAGRHSVPWLLQHKPEFLWVGETLNLLVPHFFILNSLSRDWGVPEEGFRGICFLLRFSVAGLSLGVVINLGSKKLNPNVRYSVSVGCACRDSLMSTPWKNYAETFTFMGHEWGFSRQVSVFLNLFRTYLCFFAFLMKLSCEFGPINMHELPQETSSLLSLGNKSDNQHWWEVCDF